MEEDIKVLEEFCDIFRMTQRSIDKSERDEYGEIIGQDEIKAIENLIKRNKELEKINTDLLLKLEMKKVLFVRKDELERDYIPKSKVKEIIQKYYDEYEKEKEYRYTVDVEDEQQVLREIEKELLEERN